MPCLSSLVWLCLATPAKPSERKRGQCAHSLNGYILARFPSRLKSGLRPLFRREGNRANPNATILSGFVSIIIAKKVR